MPFETLMNRVDHVSAAAGVPGGSVSELYQSTNPADGKPSGQDDTPPDPRAIPQNWKIFFSYLERLLTRQYAGSQRVSEFAEREDELFRSLAESRLGIMLKGLMDDPGSWREQLWSSFTRSLPENMRQSEMLSGLGAMAERWIGESSSWREQLCSPFTQKLGMGIEPGTLTKGWMNESGSWKPWSSFAHYLPESIRQSELLTGLSEGAEGLSDLWYTIRAWGELSKLPRLDPEVTNPGDDTGLEGG